MTTFPTVTTAYTYLQTVPIPGVPPPAPAAWSYGISNLDASTGLYYLTDRTLGGIDVVNVSTLQFLRVAGQGSFAGDRATPAHSAGPNGAVGVGNGIVFAGDGSSNVVVVNANTGATVANIPIPNTGNSLNRVDLMGFDPKDGIVIAISDSSVPWPLATFISSAPPYTILGQLVFTNATGGVDQATYDPTQGVFFESITSTSTNNNGQLDVINPTTMQIVKVLPFATQCNPAGSAVGPNEILAVSCGRDPVTNASQPSQIINATNGNSLATITPANGCDQAWYNPTDNRFFFACAHAFSGTKKNPNVSIVDAGTLSLITTIATAAGSNSVTVDPKTDRVFIPENAGKGPLGLDIFSYQ